MTLDDGGDGLKAMAAAFDLPGPVASVEPLGSGNVNDTYQVSTEGSPGRRYVLQRLNQRVFRRPDLVMANILTIGEHVGKRLARACPVRGERRWELPQVVRARRDGRAWVERGDEFWRLLTFVEAARSFDVVASADQAREVGYGLGLFHHLISDLPPERLADTLEGFHVTPSYLAHYDAVLASAAGVTGTDVHHCRAFVEDRRDFAPVLEQARARGLLVPRPIHGDPKVSNVMLDVHTGLAVALVDLDTVKPGLIHYDIGDCLRSCCNPAGEETSDLDSVRFDLERCRQVLGGYLAAAAGFLTDADYDHLQSAIRLISFELGLRFFTDHLAGDVYFRADHPGHNLQRAMVQFRLTRSIEAQERQIAALIADLRAHHSPACR
ncbi:phosphotransferase enzyme family protein [Synechococcus sp. CCY 9618]|uniref:phosphotransferase enzyme family protein n=1 Tax=Synechococcus sp. CCY 9618 TaxID=2815602 RepID=UPI001C22C5F1|nr:phosphotransferase [Synechococcus sp. CCY 9618]